MVPRNPPHFGVGFHDLDGSLFVHNMGMVYRRLVWSGLCVLHRYDNWKSDSYCFVLECHQPGSCRYDFWDIFSAVTELSSTVQEDLVVLLHSPELFHLIIQTCCLNLKSVSGAVSVRERY